MIEFPGQRQLPTRMNTQPNTNQTVPNEVDNEDIEALLFRPYYIIITRHRNLHCSLYSVAREAQLGTRTATDNSSIQYKNTEWTSVAEEVIACTDMITEENHTMPARQRHKM